MPCADGEILAEFTSSLAYFLCVDPEVGQLMANAGYPERVRYADWGLWTGAPLPEPGTCPTVDGFTICGGTCGGCPEGRVCTGRSPLHPYGICVTAPLSGNATYCGDDKNHCDPGQSCFRFTVEPDAQALADLHGWCFGPDECNAIAAGLPGGGTCTLE